MNTLTMLFKEKFNVEFSIAGLMLAALMSALMLLRIPKEERMLHEEFGKEWEEYCERTAKKVIPYVY